METTGYMQIMPGGHCFLCHKDYEEMGEDHRMFCLDYQEYIGPNTMKIKPTPCEPGCSKKFPKIC